MLIFIFKTTTELHSLNYSVHGTRWGHVTTMQHTNVWNINHCIFHMLFKFLIFKKIYSTFRKLAFHSEHSRPVLLDLFYINLQRNCQNKYEVQHCLSEVCIFALYRISLSLEYSTCWINHWQSGATIFPICVCINTWHSHHSHVCVCALSCIAP